MKITVKGESISNIIAVGVDISPDYKKSYSETMAIRRNQIYRIQQGYIKQLQPFWYKNAMAKARNQVAAK